MPSRAGPIAVTGATGYVGGRLIPRLLERGESVRALARRPAKLQGRAFAGHSNLEIAAFDLDDKGTIVSALAGASVAYYLVHSMGSGRDGGKDGFAGRDERQATDFAEACAEAGVARIIYLGGLGRREDELSLHLRSRQRTGDALREAAGSATAVTELRAGIIVGSGSASFEIIRDLSQKLPLMITPRWVRSRVEPIAISNVVDYLVGVLDEPRTVGQALDIGGGDILSYGDLLRVCAREQGRGVVLIPVPVLTPRLSSYWLHLVTSVDFGLARPLIEGLRNDAVCEDRRIREWIPLGLLDYRTAVRRALAGEGDNTEPGSLRMSRWTDADRGRVSRPSDPTAAAGAASHGPPAYIDARTFTTSLGPEQAFERVCGLGGDTGYGPGATALWRLRGMLDRLAGGVGLRRGRPPGRTLHEGDPVDFWRVGEVQEPHRLVLIAEMLVPGEARLEFTIEPAEGGGSLVHQVASLSNTSMLSGLYWYAISPLHRYVFERLGRHLLRPPASA